MDLPFLVRLSSSPLWLLAAIGAVTAILCGLFVRWRPLKDLTWKRVDYVWLSVALLGVLSESARTSIEFAKTRAEIQRPSSRFAFETLRRYIQWGASADSEGCAPRVRSQFSPTDFDDMRRAQQMLCDAFRGLDSTVSLSPGAGGEEFASLNTLGFHRIEPNILLTKYENSEITRVTSAARDYEMERSTFSDALREEQEAEHSGWIALNAGMGPLLVGLAIAIRLTKTAGEIANKKKGPCRLAEHNSST